MANRDLLADAIADAKAVKEVAIANAKAALEEAFTPHLKDMLAQKINEMEDLDEDLELAEVDKEKVDEEKEVEEGYGKKDVDEAKDDLDEAEDVDEELDLEEILAELELEEEELEEINNIDPGTEPKSFLKKKPDSAQLEEGEDVEEGKKEDLDEGEDVDEGYDKVDEAEDVVDDAEEEINLEDMSEDDLKSMIEDVIEDMIEDGELVPGPNADESEEEEDEDKDDGTEGDADVDIEVDDIDLEEGKEEKVDEEKEKMKEELEEAKAAIEQLRSDLNEVNLLNSKLLYTNKIFRGKNLTENQKIKVLKAFDKAETVKEAKAIFETLNENLVAKTKKSNIRESLGAASKPAGVAPKRAINEGIVQEDAMVNRFKQLAGIK